MPIRKFSKQTLARLLPFLLPILFIGLTTCTQAATEATEPSDGLEGLEYRLVGPWRGGRVTAVSGVPGQPNLYYMGATGGGVWKTTNAGTTWDNISDEFFKVGTIGAVAVANSDPNVLYVGTGEAPIRGVTTSHGDGMWKSTDAGASWKHIGLEKAGQIAKIQIHPTNPDIALVAVQGQIWGPSDERGVYRTTDGGLSWQQVLPVGPETGATDLVMDPSNPRTLYAAMWQHGRTPWFIKSGGTEGGIFKSTDGGDSWKKLEGGLPGTIGKIGIAISAAQPERVYAIIEAEHEKGGLWRSEDSGKSWALINGHRALHTRAWYYIHMAADPINPNTIYVLNTGFYKSIDAGKTWTMISTPHGDHHDHWINPADSDNMINGNDGGATVTFDGGKTWSSIMNQPTAQFYRVATDNLVPFRIYGGQQDNTTVAIASRSLYGGIGTQDYYDVGGGESAHVAFDPDNPRLVYAGSINGTLTEYDRDTELTRIIIPYPEMMFGKDAKDLRYRTNWNTPVAASPHDWSTIYYGTQYVLKSGDRGTTWTAISPDLTRNDPEKQGRNGGPLTPENVGAEYYNTLFYIVESPHEAGTIWAGADDGYLHVTRNGGESWQNVSPPHKGKYSNEAYINAIEVSPHDPATAYVAVAGFKLNDFSPYIYKTSDYGKSWKRLDQGLPTDTFVRVVREDPSMQGLLYAGTEAGMFVSYDDGANWRSLKLNLPPVPITDLTIRQDSLVVATQGRAYWVLDDLFVVRQGKNATSDKLRVFQPDTITMLQGSGGYSSDDFEGSNPPNSLPVYYQLPEDADSLQIEILDNRGKVIRTYSSEEGDFERCRIANVDPRMPYEPKYPEKTKGLHKWDWNFRSENLHCIEDVKLFAGFGGPSVLPGDYRLRVSAAGETAEGAFSLVSDPRLTATAGETQEWSARANETAQLLDEVLRRLSEVRKARGQIETLMADYPDQSDLQSQGKQAVAAINAWDEEIIQPLHQTYEDEDAWETMLGGQIRYLLDVIEDSGAPVTGGQLERLADVKTEWAKQQTELVNINSNLIAPINAWAADNKLPFVVPTGD
ncbi:MAG: hypothetical protein SH820_09760 [Xanthomonadales bacterium]|nr:hypothetical protein [Xanthomonadales bacterium]